MRRSSIVRAATLLLALLMPLAGMRATSPASCVDDDCDMPCCARDANHATVVPVLPCCRTVSMDPASTHATPTTIETHHLRVIAPISIDTPLVAIVIDASSPASSAHPLPAPPLYQQHCALLL